MARYTISDIENILFDAYPQKDALRDDRIGLFVGSRTAIVKKIAIALDITVPMIEAAALAGCNLLVTHHPPFIKAPDSFLDAKSVAVSNGAAIYKAAQKDVALLTMHTNLDCSSKTADILTEPVGLEVVAPLCQNATSALGQIAVPAGKKTYYTLQELAYCYANHFGAVAKVWGDPDKAIFKVAVCSGAGGEVIGQAIAAGVDCFVTGELRHHEAMYVNDANIALIELGHDISELPYRYALQETLVAAGFAYCDIVVLNPSVGWWQPVDVELL